jgi:hypothetical protein
VRIQIWSPGLDASSFAECLTQARLAVLALPDLSGVERDLPLLLLYADLLVRLQAPEPATADSDGSLLLTALPGLLAAGQRCRLVNLSCVRLPAVVAWCVDPSSPLPQETEASFPEPDPFDALLAIAFLQEYPEQLETYRELESHPMAAALDQRPPDLHCLDRYRRASGLDALMRACKQRRLLESDLLELASQLEPLQSQNLERLALQEQLALLKAQLKQADALQERFSALQLGYLAQQQDLEQLARRHALLEALVATGSAASLRLQTRLAQVLV